MMLNALLKNLSTIAQFKKSYYLCSTKNNKNNIMDYKFCNNIEDFVYNNGLGYHNSPKTIDKRLEDDDLMAMVFYCKNALPDEDLTEENVEDALIDFVNCIGDDFGWKYGTCNGWHDTIERIITLVKKN